MLVCLFADDLLDLANQPCPIGNRAREQAQIRLLRSRVACLIANAHSLFKTAQFTLVSTLCPCERKPHTRISTCNTGWISQCAGWPKWSGSNSRLPVMRTLSPAFREATSAWSASLWQGVNSQCHCKIGLSNTNADVCTFSVQSPSVAL